MKVFVAGASGTIGVPLVRALVAAGHDVTALTRTPDKQAMLRRSEPLRPWPTRSMPRRCAAWSCSARPTHVIHQLTALPKMRSSSRPRAGRDEPPADRRHPKPDRGRRRRGRTALRRRLVRAAPGAGTELPADTRDAADALKSMESQILEASRAGKIEGVVLRYGLFYSPDTPSDSADGHPRPAPPSADDPRRPQPAAVHSRRGRRERDGARARPRAERRCLRHRRRPPGEHLRHGERHWRKASARPGRSRYPPGCRG